MSKFDTTPTTAGGRCEMGEYLKGMLYVVLVALAFTFPGLARAADCVVYNVDSERGEALFTEAAMDGDVLDPAPDNMVPHDPAGKPYPGVFKAVCRTVPEYVAGEPIHCVYYNNEHDEALCQWQVWGGQAGYWTEHGDWVDYPDPCAGYNEALKRGEKLPNESTCTGIETGREEIVIPKDDSEVRT